MDCLCTLTKWAIGLAIVGGIAGFIVWVVLSSSGWKFEVAVDSATLTRFDLDRNGTLRYNLTLAVRVRNANRVVVYYNKIAAAALYGGTLFGAAEVPAFAQSEKATTTVYPAFAGQASLPGRDGSAVGRYDREKSQGVYGVDVKFYANVKVEWFSSDEYGTSTHTKDYAPEVTCALRLPVAGGGAGPPFNGTLCDIRV